MNIRFIKTPHSWCFPICIEGFTNDTDGLFLLEIGFLKWELEIEFK